MNTPVAAQHQISVAQTLQKTIETDVPGVQAVQVPQEILQVQTVEVGEILEIQQMWKALPPSHLPPPVAVGARPNRSCVGAGCRDRRNSAVAVRGGNHRGP